MTERLALGINVGASNSVAVAAVGDGSDSDNGPADGGSVSIHPSVLRLTPDAPPAFGTRARVRGRHSNDVVVEGFLNRVGDPVDMLTEDGATHPAADLVATALTCLIDEMSTRAGQSASATIACHPAWWSKHTVDIQRDALGRAGLTDVTLVPEPLAALRWLTATHGPLGDGAVAVYDLGAGGLTVSVLRTGEQSGLLGTPLRSTDIAGAEFDLLTMRHVLANALGGNDFDPFDPVVERELAALRIRCRNAKEELSINTATVVAVRPRPGDQRDQQIRLVRDELEELLRGPLLASTDLIRDAVHRAGLEVGDIGRVLLTGGGGAIPLVAELISSEFGLPVVAAPDPAQTSARGAALLATDLLAEIRSLAPTPIVARPDIEPTPKTKELPALSSAPTLPEPPKRSGLTGKQRAAIIAGTIFAIGVLTTGTVAIGTGIQSGPNHAPAVQDTTTTPAPVQVAAPSGALDPTTGRAVSPAADTTGGKAKPTGAQQTPSSDPAIVAVNNPPATGQPDPAAPAAPAPQPNPQPNPQPPTAPQQPPPQPPALPSPPTLPNLGDTVDKVGSAVPTALPVPPVIQGGHGG
ncbi:Hsp70 family protein [Nocardia arthritidis]|uniref:Hsp70 family protein n=1 Tax=Nocardia arthritidis TaxID=228602 RepID=A0A6G9YSU2_9NOCA|nr:Hsp70 family protein [Nocardia arthritidis]QIS16385.1 Hsp70 family protein [Nocardia arthritidis]